MEIIQQRHRERMLANFADETTDHAPVVKLFFPIGAATWLLTGLAPDREDLAFGLCDLGMGSPELGYVSLSELSQPVRGMTVERDYWFKPIATIGVYASLARRSESDT